MVNGIGGGGGMAREAIAAALRAQQQATQGVSGGGGFGSPTGMGGMGGIGGPSGPTGTPPTGASGVQGISAPGEVSFADRLSEGLSQVNDQINLADKLPDKMLGGEVNDFHDVAVTLKQSDLSFRFALQVRNKLIDAYREVMRMSV
jgi:flagellar hook-basal body complex protein FliE